MTTVAVVAPSCQAGGDDLRAGIAVLEEEGLRVKVGARSFEDRPHTPEEDALRARELEEAMLDPEVDAILCARGGYGVARLLDFVDWERVAGCDKRFVGYSDITTLHGILAQRCPHVSRAYGPMAASGMVRSRSPRAEQLHRFLRGEPLGDILADLRREEVRVLHPGRTEGTAAGGCLCLVVSTIGTPYQIDTAGKILILEDINEESRRVDRYLTQLLHAGMLASAAAVVCGRTFCRTDEEDPMATQDEILRRYLDPLDVPVLMDVPIGHVDELLTVPLDRPARLEADSGVRTLWFG